MLKKHIFGEDHEITYDTIINHDVYSFLRVTVEVPRGQDTEAIVVLNGIDIGKIKVVRNGKKAIYQLYRKDQTNPTNYYVYRPHDVFTKLGKAVAAVISDYVD